MINHLQRKISHTYDQNFIISRRDAYLGVLAIVIANAMESMDSTSPNNGFNLEGLPYTGATDPMWIGICVQFLSVLAWYLQLASLTLTLYTLYMSVILERHFSVATPTIIYLSASLIYYVSILFQDVTYWFNMFLTSDGDQVRVSEPANIGLYIVTELPTLLYITFHTVMLWKFSKVIFVLQLTQNKEIAPANAK